jgi:hypothetical protein
MNGMLASALIGLAALVVGLVVVRLTREEPRPRAR